MNITKINLCPAITDVFKDDIHKCKKYFKPLISIDLSIIDEKLKGQVYIVYFNDDPYCEVSKNSQNEFCDGEKVVFDVVNNKYKFKGDFGYFATNDNWKEWLLLGDKSYNEFLERKSKETFNPFDFIKNLNGEPNWITDDQTPYNSKGIKMKFICQMNSETIIDDFCAKEIYLFYDFKDRVAVQIQQFN